MEEYITLNEYMRRFKIGYQNVINLIKTNQVEYKITPSGRYRIKVGGETVSKEMYDKAIERAIKAETKLEMLRKILNCDEKDGVKEICE